LVRYAASHVLHMQKALTQMNLQIHHVLSDLTGQSGLAIVDAILRGERDPRKLAALRHSRVKASAAIICKSLEGDWRDEHLFSLRQARASYQHYQELIAACDLEIAQRLAAFQSLVDPIAKPIPPRTTHEARPRRSQPQFDLRGELYRILGVDLTQVPGLQAPTIHTCLCEIGTDMTRFPTPRHFASWMGLCPDNRITGDRVLSAKTRSVKSRLATALRMACLSFERNQSVLGSFYRRMKAKLGAPKAVTATAHKLARIIHHLITHRVPYDESVFKKAEEHHRLRRERSLRKQATAFGFQLIPLSPSPT
jgi:transposase